MLCNKRAWLPKMFAYRFKENMSCIFINCKVIHIMNKDKSFDKDIYELV